MPGSIKLPPSPISTTGTTGTQRALQPSAPAGTSPATAADRFSSSKLVTQLTGRDAVRSPGQLSSDLGTIKDANALPDRLTSDLAVHLPELVSLLNLTRQQKATRLIEFLVPYAAKLSELTAAAELPLTQTQRLNLEEKLITPMSQAGLDQVVELTTGKSGVEVAKDMLKLPLPELAMAHLEKMIFDAPTWASRPEAALANEVKRGEPALTAQPTIVPTKDARISGKGNAEEEEQKVKDRTDKVLGKNMVWNVLHMFNAGEGPMDEAKKKEMLLATGGLVILVITVAAVIALALVLAR